MPVYLRAVDRERVLLDTAKAHLDYEGTRYDLTGAALEFYNAPWEVGEATLGDERVPARGLVLMDPFTGLRIEVAFTREAADALAIAFADDPTKPKRQRRLTHLLRGDRG